MASIPRSLRFYLNSMSISRNKFRIRPLGQPDAYCGDVISFDLPNSLIDLDSLTLAWELTTTITGASTACYLSQGVESAIEQISVESNGYMIDSGCQMTNQLYQTFLDWTLGEDKKALRKVLNHHTTTSAAGKTHTNEPMALTNWIGLLGSVQPRKFDVSTCPLRVYVKLAAANRAFIGAGAAPSSATSTQVFKKITAYVDSIDIQDGGLYYEGVQKLMQQAPLELPFDKFYTSLGSVMSGTEAQMNLTLSANSIDYVAGLLLHPDALKAANSWLEVPFKPEGWTDLTLPSALDTPWTAQTSNLNYLAVSINNSATDTYKSTYFVHGVTAGQTLTTSQFNVNNVSYPTFPATASEAFAQTADAFGVLRDTVGGSAKWLNGLSNYQEKGFVHVVPFQFPGAEPELRLKSGLNTLGNNAGIVWDIKTSAANASPLLVAKTTAVLRVAPYKQIETVL